MRVYPYLPDEAVCRRNLRETLEILEQRDADLHDPRRVRPRLLVRAAHEATRAAAYAYGLEHPVSEVRVLLQRANGYIVRTLGERVATPLVDPREWVSAAILANDAALVASLAERLPEFFEGADRDPGSLYLCRGLTSLFTDDLASASDDASCLSERLRNPPPGGPAGDLLIGLDEAIRAIVSGDPADLNKALLARGDMLSRRYGHGEGLAHPGALLDLYGAAALMNAARRGLSYPTDLQWFGPDLVAGT